MEYFIQNKLLPFQVDMVLAHGFRRFGEVIYRTKKTEHAQEEVNVLPLRVNLAAFEMRKSQRKIFQKNKNLFTDTISQSKISTEEFELFEIHKQRFKENQPESPLQYLGENYQGDDFPTQVLTIKVFDGQKLIAASYLDIGEKSVSAIYGMFHPDYAAFSLGNYTMLLELLFAISQQKAFYYQGYCYDKPSFYDYKKKFIGTEFLDFEDMIWKDLVL